MQVDAAPSSRRRARVFSADDVLNGDDNSGHTKRLRLLGSHSSSSLWSWDRIDEGNEYAAACSDDDDEDDETPATNSAGAEAHDSMTRWWGPTESSESNSSSNSAVIDPALANAPSEELQNAMAPELPVLSSSTSSSDSSSFPAAAAPASSRERVPKAPPSPVSSQVLRGLEAISLRPGRKHSLRTSLLPPPGVRVCPAAFAVANGAKTTQRAATHREMQE